MWPGIVTVHMLGVYVVFPVYKVKLLRSYSS